MTRKPILKKPQPLTAAIIACMKQGEERGDAQCAGLRVRCLASGQKVFFYRCRARDGALREIQEGFGDFDSYCWRFVGGRPKPNHWKAARQIPTTSPESDAFSKDLKLRGFSFVGPTVVYAYMQAVGMVNDHVVDCFRYRKIRQEQENPRT